MVAISLTSCHGPLMTLPKYSALLRVRKWLKSSNGRAGVKGRQFHQGITAFKSSCQLSSILQIFYADNHHPNSHMRRLARKHFAGTHTPLNSMPTHDHDLENLENPEQFDASGFCFAKMKLQKDVKKFDMVAASPKFFCSDPFLGALRP